MSRPPKELYTAPEQGIFDKIRVCINNFFGTTPIEKKKKNDKRLCERCGRTSHNIEQCYAKTHVDGSELNSYLKRLIKK